MDKKTPNHILAAREKLAAKYSSGARTGGKGSVRRKKKAVQKQAANSDEKRLQATLKKLHVTPIDKIEEVTLVNESGGGIKFSNPKVLANPSANTFVVSGEHTDVELSDLFAGGMSQQALQALLSSYSKSLKSQGISEEDIKNAAASTEGDEDVPASVTDDFEGISEEVN